MPTCLFINLDAAEGRRRSVEASFAAAEPHGWRLQRFPALGPQGRPSPLPPGAQGCFHSHCEAVAAGLSDDAPLMVIEDDSLFARACFAGVEALLAKPDPWDLLLSDAIVLDPALMVNMGRARNAFAARGAFAAVDLRDRLFAGASGYVVRGGSKRKVAEAFAAGDLCKPIDLHLRDLCQQGVLKVAAAIPFLTSQAPAAEVSQISGEDPAWDRPNFLFRRYMFLDRDLDALMPEAEALIAGAEPEGRALAAVVAAYASPGFRKLRNG